MREPIVLCMFFFQKWLGAVYQNVPALTSHSEQNQSSRGIDGKQKTILPGTYI